MNRSIASLFVLIAMSLVSGAVHADEAAGKAAFKKQVFPILRNRCSTCHGLEQAPLFAVEDADAAYMIAKTKIDFADLMKKRTLLDQSQNGHCGAPGCRPDDKVMHPAALKAALTAWMAANGAPSTGTTTTPSTVMMSDAVKIPANLPTDSFKVMRWQLKGMPDVYVEAQIQKFGLDGYTLRNPRIASKTYAMRVRSIRFYYNGEYDSKYDAFSGVDRLVPAVGASVFGTTFTALPAAPTASPTLSTQNLILIMGTEGMDTLAVAIDEIKKVEDISALSCKALPTFVEKVLPVMAARNCYYCHGGGPENQVGSSPAKDSFPMTANDADLCRGSIVRADMRLPGQSPLLKFPAARANGHPNVLPFRSEIEASYLPWLAAEKAARAGSMKESNESYGSDALEGLEE